MKKIFALAILLAAAGPAQAEDSICGALVKQAQAGLKSSQLHDVVRDRLQRMLDTGLKGNITQCIGVANGALAEDPLPTCNEKPSV